MGTVTINGKTYSGNSVVVTNDTVIIDGKVQRGEVSGVVQVVVSGDIGYLKSNASVTVNGNVSGNIDAGGSVQCLNIDGNVDAGGSVSCKNVGGGVDAGGSVSMSGNKCGVVGNGAVVAGGIIFNK